MRMSRMSMSLGSPGGFVPSTSLQVDAQEDLPIFDIEPVNLRFSVSADFVAAQVANNVLIIALSTGRILRIDLDNPLDIDDIDLPKKTSEVGVIERLFLDPSASHLIITTALGENYYLHTQSRQPKSLSRLRNVFIKSIAWNPSQPTASTREILVGAADGNVYEVYIEPSTEFYRREEKYVKSIYKADSKPITGLWIEAFSSIPDARRVLLCTPYKIYHFSGKVNHHGSENRAPVFAKFFDSEIPVVHEVPSASSDIISTLAVTPETEDASEVGAQRSYAWLNGQGVLYGPLASSNELRNLGDNFFKESKMLTFNQLPLERDIEGNLKPKQVLSDCILAQWHMILLVGSRIMILNILDQSIVLDQPKLTSGQTTIGLFADQTKNTFWVFTNEKIFEIIVNNETRDLWRILLAKREFDRASIYAKTSENKDAVATASGDFLTSKGKYMEAAKVYGRSSKPFEDVALAFIDHGEQNALREYLLTKLASLEKNRVMQRTMVAIWLVEVFMAKLDNLDDTVSTKAELTASTNAMEANDELSNTRREFRDFMTKYHPDLDHKTTYSIINSHGREEELLHFASVISDFSYILSYWVQRERWKEALNVLKKETDPESFYRYSNDFMTHTPVDFVDILMRQDSIDAKRLIPAFLNYNKITRVSPSQNQAIRYLQFYINQTHSKDSAVHNTFISIHASHSSDNESALLSYLQAQTYLEEQNYDTDFALRICIQNKRVQSCVHIYSSMGQYAQAVDLALKHEETELAASVADRNEIDPPLRKKLWQAIAKNVISKTASIKEAIEFLKRCPLLRIEDLIPFFPDFVVIDDFKEEICAALEEYSRHIDALKQEMDDSAATAAHIKVEVAALDRRYAIVEPGERCYICRLPLLARQFFVFPCQHAFHNDCLAKKVMSLVGTTKTRRIRDLQAEIGDGLVMGVRKEKAVKELDSLIASACVLCSEIALKQIDEPFILSTDDETEWAL